ncbi:hypothetical protein PGT21_003667 [Puccinia graminis f. sp. tritici]|uniref:Uncharacterized protein n=1 Tax=Puccinia graminis f. sp. tritici TaxID=56615 RepID=A0A5B0M5N6_PUCGR|nr:hypothetical protein PGT21_003667 [Puccinia graminis f. sp. tritici]
MRSIGIALIFRCDVRYLACDADVIGSILNPTLNPRLPNLAWKLESVPSSLDSTSRLIDWTQLNSRLRGPLSIGIRDRSEVPIKKKPGDLSHRIALFHR